MKLKNTIIGCLILIISNSLYGEEESSIPEEVEQIVITANKEPMNPGNTTAQVTIITSDQIDSMAARNAAEIVATVPGVNTASYGARGQSKLVSIRGSSADQVLVLVNGKKINTVQGGGVDLSLINPDTIERIEIIRGGMSAVYGDGAFGGVVNIVLKEGSNKKLNLAASYSFSYFNSHDVSASIGSGLGEEEIFDFNLAINGFYTNGKYDYYSSDYNEIISRENSDGFGGGISLDLGWDLIPDDKMRLELNSQIRGSKKGVPGMEQFASKNAEMEDLFTIGSINYSWMENMLGSIEFDFSFQHQLRHYSDPDWYLDPVDDTHKNNAVASNIKISRSDRFKFMLMNNSIGYSFRYDYLDSTAIVLKETEGESTMGKYSNSAFYRGDFHLFQKKTEDLYSLILSPSIRYDSVLTICQVENIERYENKFSWNAGWMINFDPKQKYLVKGNIGTAYHLPTFDDLFWPDTGFAMGNPDLKPENAFNIDAGMIIKPFTFISLELVYYRQLVEDLIQWTPGAGGIWRPKNIGNALLTGLETELKTLVDLSGISCFLEGSFNYSLLISRNRESGIAHNGMQLIYRPEHQCNVSITLNHYNGHSLNISGAYTGFRYLTEGNTKYLDDHFILNATLSVKLFEAFDFIVYGKNLLNISYIDRRQYPVPGFELGTKARYTF